jgi:hypothetical protein
MFRSIAFLTVVLAALSAGCDPSKDEPPPDVKDTIFDEQVKALDKARSVEDIQDEHMKKLRDSEDKSGGQ